MLQGKKLGVDRGPTETKRKELDRDQLVAKLQQALAEVKTLSGLVSICSHCKKIRDDRGLWMQLETYIQEHTNAHFTHGICPECVEALYPDQYVKMKGHKSSRAIAGRRA